MCDSFRGGGHGRGYGNFYSHQENHGFHNNHDGGGRGRGRGRGRGMGRGRGRGRGRGGKRIGQPGFVSQVVVRAPIKNSMVEWSYQEPTESDLLNEDTLRQVLTKAKKMEEGKDSNQHRKNQLRTIKTIASEWIQEKAKIEQVFFVCTFFFIFILF